MFQSCGFFSSIPCQFYLSGLCERPFCHFRHSRHDVEKSKENAASTTNDNLDSSATESFGQQSSTSEDSHQTSAVSSQLLSSSSLKETSQTFEPSGKTPLEPYGSSHENNGGSFSIPSFTDNSKYQVPIAEEPEQYVTSLDSDQASGSLLPKTDAGKSALPTYLPTPKTPSLPVPEPIKDDLGIPVYQPTPKRELKRRHEDQVQTKKAKSADLEYDPECNFSCEGLIGVSQIKCKIETDALDYKPTEKKPRIAGFRNRNRLSCESQIASSPKAQDEDEEMPEGEFSEQEEEMPENEFSEQEDLGKPTDAQGQGTKGGVRSEDFKSESFENIGDDDISSDDDFIDVPILTTSESKQRKHSAVKLGNKKLDVSSSGVSKTKTVSSRKEQNKGVPSRTDSAGTKENQNKVSKHVSSKSSSSEHLSKSASQGKVDKLSLSQQKDGHGSKKSSASAKGHLAERSSSSEKTTSSKLQTQQKTEPRTKDAHTKNKTGVWKDNHTEKQSSSKSLSKTSSSDKLHTSSKHSSSKKTVLSDSRTSVSSGRSASDSSSDRRKSTDGKNKDCIDRQSSLDGKTPKDGTVKVSDRSVDAKNKYSSERPSSSENKMSKDVRDKSFDPKKRSNIVGKNSNTVSKKYSDSDKKCLDTKISAKHSNSQYKTSSGKLAPASTDNRYKLSPGGKRSSTDSNSWSLGSKKVGERYGTARDHSKDRTVHSSKVHCSSKLAKEHKSSHSESQKSSSGKRTDSSRITNSSSKHKKQKPSDINKGANKKDSSRTLERMNSSLFGDDSDDNLAESEVTCDGTLPDIANDSSECEEAQVEESVDYSYINESDLEDADPFEELLQIYNETPQPKKTPIPPEKKLTKNQKTDSSASREGDSSFTMTGKKRIAHKAAEQIRRPELQKKERPRHLLSPQEQMHNRIMKMQQRAQERAAMQAVQEQEVSSTSGSAPGKGSQGQSSGGGKKRIAHVPKPVTPSTSSSTRTSSSGQKKITVAITASKTEKRIAHVPNLSNLKRPVIPASFGSKVPSNIRQRYLNLIIDECIKFCPDEEMAYKKGLEEETMVYERSSNKNIYLRVAVNTITRLRQEARESMPGSSKSEQRQSSGPSQSHAATLGGARAAKTNFTLHRSLGSGKKTEVALTGPELYQKMLKYLLKENELVENGYPRPCPDTPGKATMQARTYQDTDTLLKDNERTCSRCGKRFIVNYDGSYVREEECVYHWARAYPRKKSGFFQHIYNCCNSDTSSKGCQVAANHVHERNKRDSLTGFMTTMPRTPPKDGNYGIFALDCEMVYTLGGLELARVTVVNTEGESVYESLVRPFHPIVDYNSRFSGITAADLEDVSTTLIDVQAILLSMFSDKTVLMGHSLESDFFALKLIHSTVVDTSVVFPHRLGPPYKRALKNLMLETFQKIIQCDDAGHDSKEDALACLQLMKWRIKEDSKRENRYSRD